jgi:hypothetical protein
MEPRGGRNWGEVIAPQVIPSLAGVVGPGQQRSQGLVYQRAYEWREYPETAPKQQYREDPKDPESELLERDAPWWTPLAIGFRARILVNPLGGEVRHEAQAFIGALTKTGSEADHLKTIADRVVAWDYVQISETGERIPIPPPGDPEHGGWERFLDMPNDAMVWLVEEIRSAHLPKAPTTSKPAGSTESTTPTTIDPEPEPPPS